MGRHKSIALKKGPTIVQKGKNPHVLVGSVKAREIGEKQERKTLHDRIGEVCSCMVPPKGGESGPKAHACMHTRTKVGATLSNSNVFQKERKKT